MSLIALISAAAVSAAVVPPARAEPAVNLYPRSLPSHCRMGHRTTRLFGDTRADRSLRDMPRADLHRLVDRRVDGCPVPTIVRHDVEGDGRAARPSR